MVVLYTNVISEEMKPAPSSAVHGWLQAQVPTVLFTTTITEAEIRFGLELLPNGRRKRAIVTAAEHVLGLFQNRILAFDSSAAREYAVVVARRRRLGRPIEIADAQIAAIARAHGMAIATRDAEDFADTGVRIIDPWRP